MEDELKAATFVFVKNKYAATSVACDAAACYIMTKLTIWVHCSVKLIY